MSQANSIRMNNSNHLRTAILIIAFVMITIAGLSYVKWWPYYHKAILAIEKHSIGSSLLSGSIDNPSLAAAWEYAGVYFKSIWKAAVLGILLGSLVQVLLPSQWLQRVLGKATFRSTLYGGVASIPGMMCSCCAAPIAASLRKRNVSVGASLAFWIGNPVLNPATLIFMTFVLSWKFTLIRVLFGVLLTFGVSYLANRITDRKQIPVNPVTETTIQATSDKGSFFFRWMKSLGTLLLQVIPAYIITVLVLGAFQGWMFPVSLNGVLAILIFALFGMLFVIPTAAEIPIIASFLALGVGTGPVAALLLTLPAVSLPSLIMVSRSFPRRVILFVALSVVVVGVLSGLIGTILL
ncbi:permease [Cohnella luojiensis]|uniref:Permease n=1 Tax=Cohnella luojiensis TaxID=652876 RepID=A0A4Y8LNZ0_9BACL|nr:permease [Cohnella luojiensis]TFE22725.1 permease [Cohnella luojiensis]